MDIVRNKDTLRDAIRRLRAEGKTIGLVPTMGALHEGHVSLVEIAKRHADVIVASIFVNPMQFGPNEDFSKYPRSEAEDLEKLNKAGTALVYMPTAEEMYPPGAITKVSVPGISSELCGAFRPGHFDGVATIVTKLFMQVTPDVAVFGEKDYQQLYIIKRMTHDLDIPAQVIGAPTLREPDGLAMSSRNRYLSVRELMIAVKLYNILSTTGAKLKGEQWIGAMLKKAEKLLLSAGFSKVDYVELRDAETLASVTELKKPARLLAAAHLGTTRLIDNVEVKP